MFLPVLFLLLWTGTSIAVFFHEKSSIVLAPHDDNNGSFGFSLGYQGGENASLVIGAPLYDLTGRVFKRSIQDILHGNTTCEPLDINFDVLNITYNRRLRPDQHFYLGASIAATENMFVTCAPLRTTNGVHYHERKKKDVFGAYAACFTYDNSGTARACQNFGVDFLLKKTLSVSDFTYGSSGWSSMIDKDKNKIIISKSFNTAELSYSTLDPRGSYKSLSWFRRPKVLALEKTVRINNTASIQLTKTNFGKAMTFGNYFDKDTSKTYYAFSLRDMSGKGAVDFFPSDNSWKPLYRLKDNSVGNMFGAALVSADVTRDGCAELLVGAPAHVEDTRSSDRGAVHVYTRSDTLKMVLKLIIWGVTDGARFGSTLSTNDVDGDSYPEVFVSAPFEINESGVGALYILCGHELHNLKVTEVSVSQLKRTQRIAKETHKIFGFSLQPVSDFDDNGSDELGVGAPGNSRVTLFLGVRAITVKVTSKFPETVLDPDSGSSFLIFSSCVTVDLPMKPKIITTKLLVNNVINGKGTFNNSDEATYEIDLATEVGKLIVGNLREYCRNINIVNASFCIVNTTVSTVGNIQDLEEFNGTWTTLSAQSDLTRSNHFECVCPKPSCAPELTTELQWSGSNTENITAYLIGSSLSETVKVVVRNTGTKGCSSCALIRVSGLDHQLQCQREGSVDPRYKCAFDSFMGNTTQIIEIQLVMDKLSNQKTNFTVDVEPRSKCDEPGPVTSITVPYDFTGVLENVIINGTSMDRDLADTEIHDESEEIILLEQTYTIMNKQSFAWKNILVNLIAKNEPYIQNLSLRGAIKQTGKCVEYNGTDDFVWSCVFNLAPYSITKMSLSATIIKKELANYLDNGNITIASELVLELFPDKSNDKTLTTVLTFKQEKTFSNDKTLIIVVSLIAALLFLLIVAVVLTKLNFFERKIKQKLKQEIRRRSIRRESSRRQAPSDAGESRCQPCETVGLIPVKECNSQSDAAPSGDAARSSYARHENTTHAQFD